MVIQNQIAEPIQDRLIRFSEALKIIGISRSSAYRLLSKNLLPQPIKIGMLNFFSERELQAWISQKLDERTGGGCHE